MQIDASLAIERVFQASSASGAHDVRLAVGPPERDPEGDWRCRVRITGGVYERDQFAGGVDGLQALILALEMARIDLRVTAWQHGHTLTWLESSDLGIPAMLPNSPVS